MPRHAAAVLYAWLGGAAFLGSLAYFLYVYAVTLGRPAHASRNGDWLGPVLVDVALFGTFALHHSLMARSGAKRLLARWLPPSLERATYVWVASALFAGTCAAWQPVPGTLYAADGLTRWAGYAVQLAGGLLALESTRALDPLELAGIRQALATGRPERGWSPGLHPTAQPLLEGGPYRLVRHPLYLGWLLFVFGAPLMTASRFTFAGISTAYLLAAIPWEERSLEETFGAAYRAYAARVRWRVLPGIY